MARMRARAVIGSTLLVLVPLLAACGDESDQPEAGDIIRARVDNQFKDGREAEVLLPTGKLLIHAGKPVDNASADETRTREEVDAPSGSVLMPITWQYDPWASDRLDGIMAAEDTPIVDLVSGDQDYRLTPPERSEKAGESFYVVVDGDGADRSLEITFDGVTQTVDLRTGKRDAGDAAALYDVGGAELKKKSCDKGKKWFAEPTVGAEFTCEQVGPVLTPYAAGRWAPADSMWLALTLTTSIRIYGETDLKGGGARYTATNTDVKARIDDEKPTSVMSARGAADVCPLVATSTCGWSKTLVFEVPADDGEQGPLDLKVSYDLKLATAWNGYDAPKRKTVDAEESLKIWKD